MFSMANGDCGLLDVCLVQCLAHEGVDLLNVPHFSPLTYPMNRLGIIRQ
jgi:hypothetical protein